MYCPEVLPLIVTPSKVTLELPKLYELVNVMLTLPLGVLLIVNSLLLMLGNT